VFTVTREVLDKGTGKIATAADYSMLGWLLIAVAIVSVAAPLITIFMVQRSTLKTND
jgi:hypothetical protein